MTPLNLILLPNDGDSAVVSSSFQNFPSFSPSSSLILLPAKVGGLLDNKGYGIGLPPSELINTKQWRETFPFSQFATFVLQPGIFRFLPSDWQSHKKLESVKLFNIYFDSKLFFTKLMSNWADMINTRHYNENRLFAYKHLYSHCPYLCSILLLSLHRQTSLT